MDRMKSETANLRDIINLLPGNVYWMDRNGVTLGCNNNVLKLHGFTSHQEYVGKRYKKFFEDEEFALIQKTDSEIMHTDKPKILEEVAKRDGKVVATYLTHKVPLHDENGKVTGLLGISLDITDKKKLEQKVRKAEVKAKLQDEKIKAMQTIAASIAHELRTPLRAIRNNTAIKKYMATLIDGYEQAKAARLPVPDIGSLQFEAIKEAITAIQQETDYANNFINMLLVNVKELEDPTQHFKTYSSRGCVREALQRYPFLPSEQRDLVQTDIKADFQFKGAKPLLIHIIFNLLKNALYYIDKAGKGQISITLKKTKKHNMLVFRDSAMGIPAAELPHIFEYFFTTSHNGTGIGLTFCKMAMHNMGGHIECTSQEGSFTEFALYFPPLKVLDE